MGARAALAMDTLGAPTPTFPRRGKEQGAPSDTHARRPDAESMRPTKERTVKHRSITLAFAIIAMAALAACDPKPQPPKASALPLVQVIA